MFIKIGNLKFIMQLKLHMKYRSEISETYRLDVKKCFCKVSRIVFVTLFMQDHEP